VWGRVGADKFLLDQVHERLSFTATLSAFQMLTDKWPQASLKLIEDKANGPAVINTLRQKISGIVAVQPMGSKQARAAAVTPQVESGNVYLPHPHLAPWVWDYIEELASFPNGANDDQVDQTSQALIRLEQGGTVHTEVATATMQELAGVEAPEVSPALARYINPLMFPRRSGRQDE
jgi:predicted phage terminase large subunit-like protein